MVGKTPREGARESDVGESQSNGRRSTPVAERARPSAAGSDAATRRDFLRAGAAGTAALALGSTAGTAAASVPTPRLYVDGKYVKDPADNTVKLRGFSIADPHWYDTKEAWLGKSTLDLLEWVTDESQGWHPNHVRLPVTQDSVSEAGGYESYIEKHLRPAVDFLGEQGVYALVDNHIVRPYTAEATEAANDSYDQDPDPLLREFWNAVAPEFADDDHVIYELFNEPIGPRNNGLESWNTWRETAQPWVDLIQEHAPATPVVVGSPQWCQLTHYAHLNPFVQDNVIYAAHIYTQEYMRPWEDYFGDTVAEVPFINSEWGWDGTSDAYVDSGTRDNYGAPLMEWMESHDSVHWTAWCMDPSWGPTMVERDDSGTWQLLGGNDHHGEFIKQWLADTKDDLIPQVESGETPFTGGFGDDGTAPPAPASLSVDRTTEVGADLSWDPVEDVGAGLSYYVLYLDGEEDRLIDDSLTSITLSGLDPSTTYEVGLAAVDRAGNESDATTVTVETVARDARQSPYGTNVVPGRIEAEDFDEGGNGIAYYDTTPGNEGGLYRETDVDIESRSEDGHSIGWVSDGEWWEYTVDVRAEATYAVHVRFASGQNGGGLRVEVDGEEVGSSNVWNTGGYGSWNSQRIGEVDLTPGEHLVRVTATSGGWNYDWMEFTAQGDVEIPEDATAPPSPANLAVESTGTSQVTVSWTGVTDEGGAGLDHYAVSANGSDATTVPAGTTTATVEGLAPGSAHEIGVRAVDGAGNASDPATTTATTDEGSGLPRVGDADSPPRDPDEDGLYEDVNGDGATNLADAGDLFQNRHSDAVQEEVEAYDFSGNDEIDLADVVELFTENTN